MLSFAGTVLALALGLLMGGAEAGEELMPMRAGAPDGRTSVVMAKASPRDAEAGFGTNAGRKPAGARAAGGYVDWKNTCVRAPLLVAGGTLEVGTGANYGSARPYVALPERRDGFMAYLARELTPE